MFEGEITVITETLWDHARCIGRQEAGEPGAERAEKSNYEALGSEIVQGFKQRGFYSQKGWRREGDIKHGCRKQKCL